VIKLICFVKRNPSLSVDEFHDQWRGRHARLISETPGVADRIVRYEQNHRAPEDYARGGDFDGVAIQWFDSMSDFVEMVSDPEYQTRVAPDEDVLLDRDGLVWILTDEEEVVITGPDEREESVIKLICMVKRRPGMTIDHFHQHWRTVHSPLNCNTPTIAKYFVRYERNHRNRHDYEREGGSAFDGTAVEWYPSLQAFYDMVGEPAYRERIAPDEDRFLDRGSLVWLLTEKEETIIG
jgi:EthD domain